MDTLSSDVTRNLQYLGKDVSDIGQKSGQLGAYKIVVSGKGSFELKERWGVLVMLSSCFSCIRKLYNEYAAKDLKRQYDKICKAHNFTYTPSKTVEEAKIVEVASRPASTLLQSSWLGGGETAIHAWFTKDHENAASRSTRVQEIVKSITEGNVLGGPSVSESSQKIAAELNYSTLLVRMKKQPEFGDDTEDVMHDVLTTLRTDHPKEFKAFVQYLNQENVELNLNAALLLDRPDVLKGNAQEVTALRRKMGLILYAHG